MDFKTLKNILYSIYNQRFVGMPTTTDQNELKLWHASTLDFFRHQFEPYVYQYLTGQYGSKLDAFWKTHTFPKQSKYAVVMVERRCHPNWWFVLRNIAWAAPHCSLYIFCSDMNIDVLRSYLGEKAETVHLISWFKGVATKEEGFLQMESTMTSPDFYEKIDAEYMIGTQLDAYFLQKIPENVFTGDFYGSPWVWEPQSPGGGGITVRNIAAMITICQKEMKEGNKCSGPEDCWIGTNILKHGYVVPPLEFRIQKFLENGPSPLQPIGVHQFWTFVSNFGLNTNREFFEKYVKMLLTIVELE
jgi:hypothetical protein